MVECPSCGCVNEATVRNDFIDWQKKEVMGPVWKCNACEWQWTDYEAEDILELYYKEKQDATGIQ